MHFFKSKLFLAIICLVLAAAIAFLLLPRLYENKTQIVTILKPALDLKAGTLIDDAMLLTTEVGAYGLSEKVARTREEVVGKVVVTDIYAGEQIWTDRLITAEEYEQIAEESSKGLEAGICLVTIKFPTASSGIAGILRAGNIVDVYECAEDEEKQMTVTKALSSIHVYDVLNMELQSLSKLDEIAASVVDTNDVNLDFEPAYVIIRCTEADAQTLIRLERMEALHLTLQRTGG